MNTDRFLTRVFDRQEGKMIYQGDGIGEGTEFYGIYQDNIIIKEVYMIEYDCFSLCEMGDRFVPMMCSGKHDANDKLIYEGDIIKTSDSQYLIYWRQEYYGFLARCLTETLDLSLDNFEVEEVFEALEIIGNRWENEKLLEANE